uniref:Uncharacterized protein n=1 Tax=Arundo donax TaxID=35708 RepID=A0A0A8YQ43_ARUDO
MPGCHSELEKRFRERGSPERNKISHVRRVEIGESFFIMGKKCSWDTFDKLRNADGNTVSSWLNQPEENGNCFESTLNGWRN